jgi:hypothetical protein
MVRPLKDWNALLVSAGMAQERYRVAYRSETDAGNFGSVAGYTN